ncbi:MAG TPA: TolC family outer membrane protein [Gammaproteobacteria bacterium]|nr:TolC family outer membrane protein [Gammaproteobacteria bacterium]
MQKLRLKLAMLVLLGCWQTLHAEDLLAIYQLALKNDAQLQIAEANYLAAIQSLPQAQSGRKPQVFFNANGTRQEIDDSRIGDTTTDTIGYSLNLTQSLYDNETSGNINSAEATSRAELARLQSVRQAVALRVAEAYFAILAAHDSVDFAYAERTAIGRQLEQAQKRFEVGLIAITDVQEAKARFDSAEAQAILAENVLENAYQALVVITGDPSIKNLARLEKKLNLSLPDPANPNDWVELALKNNRDLIAAQEDLNAARYERDKRNRRGYPTVDLVASYADRDVDDDLLGSSDQQDLTVGIELQIPLYTGGRITAEQSEAEAQLVAAQNNTLLQNRLASQRSRIAFLDVVSGISQVNALKQALESSNVALEATQAGFEVGTRTSVDVLISLRETYRAQRDYASSRYQYLLNKLRLKQAAGTLMEDDLREINRLLIHP